MLEADLLLLHSGAPVLVVEVKGRAIPAHMSEAVRAQLRRSAETAGSPWALLVDPDRASLYRARDFERPEGTVPTDRIWRFLETARRPQGERSLMLAVGRWLAALQQGRADGADRASLAAPFLDDLSEVDEIRWDAPLG